MSSGLDWERFGVITGGDEVYILPPPTFVFKRGGYTHFVHFPYLFFPNEQCGGWGGGVCCQTFSFVLFSLLSRPRAGLATV